MKLSYFHKLNYGKLKYAKENKGGFQYKPSSMGGNFGPLNNNSRTLFYLVIAAALCERFSPDNVETAALLIVLTRAFPMELTPRCPIFMRHVPDLLCKANYR